MRARPSSVSQLPPGSTGLAWPLPAVAVRVAASVARMIILASLVICSTFHGSSQSDGDQSAGRKSSQLRQQRIGALVDAGLLRSEPTDAGLDVVRRRILLGDESAEQARFTASKISTV